MKKAALQHFLAVFIVAVIALLLLLFYIIPSFLPLVPGISAPICGITVCLRTMYAEARAKTFTIPYTSITVASARAVLFAPPPAVRSICPYGTGQLITNTSGRIIKYTPSALDCDPNDPINGAKCKEKLTNKTIKKIVDDINTCWGIFKTCGQDPLMEEPNVFYFCSSVFYDLGNLDIFYREIYKQMDVNLEGSLQNKTGKEIPIKIFKYGGEYVPNDSFDSFNQKVIIHTVFMDYGDHGCQYTTGECNSTLTAFECLAKTFGFSGYDNALYNYRVIIEEPLYAISVAGLEKPKINQSNVLIFEPSEKANFQVVPPVMMMEVHSAKCRKMVSSAWSNYPPLTGPYGCADGASLERFYIGSWGIPIRFTKACSEPDAANLCDNINSVPFSGCKDQIWLVVQQV